MVQFGIDSILNTMTTLLMFNVGRYLDVCRKMQVPTCKSVSVYYYTYTKKTRCAMIIAMCIQNIQIK